MPYLQDPDFTSCECGCGQPAPIATYSHAARGWVKGQPKRFISGHNARGTDRPLDDSYHTEDRGFTSPCWIWDGNKDAGGYGRVNRERRPELAHRVLFRRAYGWLPAVLHHKCAVHECVNPEHLEPTSHEEHQRLEQAARTRCRRGHEYAEHGHTRADGRRYCRACERANWHRRKRAAA